ncbi:MAG: glutamine--scyllo-inositol aminotransferase, partial [Candidatus Hydrogenedentes bacterium]|nr:glutamine--scyllo-inositol aminotransferase [Candidatus Hydrogenedentota bacterium]
MYSEFMQDLHNIPRRDFLAASAAGMALAGGLANAAEGPAAKLAVDGGEKAVTAAFTIPPRFGDPERERLEQMLGQDTLFYWKGPQTTIFTERFQHVCPAKYVMTCSSGTAALHIAA